MGVGGTGIRSLFRQHNRGLAERQCHPRKKKYHVLLLLFLAQNSLYIPTLLLRVSVGPYELTCQDLLWILGFDIGCGEYWEFVHQGRTVAAMSIKQCVNRYAFGSLGDDVLVQCLLTTAHRACGEAIPKDVQESVFIRPIDTTVAQKSENDGTLIPKSQRFPVHWVRRAFGSLR